MVKQIDCRGMACPLPIINTRRAMHENASGTELLVLVDNELAARNVTSFLDGFGVKVRFTPSEGGFAARFANPGLPDGEMAEAVVPACPTVNPPLPTSDGETPSVADRPVILCLSNALGNGDDGLGEILMKGFLSTVSQWRTLPCDMLFLNSGVRLTCRNSGALEALQSLESQGVRIRSCGMCLDFYKLRDSLCVGEISNMLDISACIAEAHRLIRL